MSLYGPELGFGGLVARQVEEHAVRVAEAEESALQAFLLAWLDEVNAEALEGSALSKMGGLEGELNTGACFVEALKDLARGE